jgi:hypothetical protein
VIVEKRGGVIAIDGKTICNSSEFFKGTKATHIVTAFAAENDIILGQLRTDEKLNSSLFYLLFKLFQIYHLMTAVLFLLKFN